MSKVCKVYWARKIRTELGGFRVEVHHEKDGKVVSSEDLDPKPSQEIINHSPNGFNWGYSGSGPAQLALGLLLDITQDRDVAKFLYHTFKNEVIAKIEHEEWQMYDHTIKAWIRKKVRGNAHFRLVRPSIVIRYLRACHEFGKDANVETLEGATYSGHYLTRDGKKIARIDFENQDEFQDLKVVSRYFEGSGEWMTS